MAPPWGNRPARRKVGRWFVEGRRCRSRYQGNLSKARWAAPVGFRSGQRPGAPNGSALGGSTNPPQGWSVVRSEGRRFRSRYQGNLSKARWAAPGGSRSGQRPGAPNGSALGESLNAPQGWMVVRSEGRRFLSRFQGDLWVGTEWVIRHRRNDGGSPRSSAGCRRRWPRVPSSGEERAGG